MPHWSIKFPGGQGWVLECPVFVTLTYSSVCRLLLASVMVTDRDGILECPAFVTLAYSSVCRLSPASVMVANIDSMVCQ